MTANPKLPWTVIAEQRDEAIRWIEQLREHPNLRAWADAALARIAELGKGEAQPEPWDGKTERRRNERRVADDSRMGLEYPFRRMGLDRRRKPQPDADDWIEWHGGECPVPEGRKFQIRRRDGYETSVIKGAKIWAWGPPDKPRVSDIIAYRIVEERK